MIMDIRFLWFFMTAPVAPVKEIPCTTNESAPRIADPDASCANTGKCVGLGLNTSSVRQSVARSSASCLKI
jgi:hypothetical protein